MIYGPLSGIPWVTIIMLENKKDGRKKLEKAVKKEIVEKRNI